MIVLHYTGMRTGEEALQRLVDRDVKVSAHYLVEEDGRIFLMVDEARRAWHAGVSFWQGERDINAVSIGIEIVNPGHEWGYRSFPVAQIEAVIALIRDIRSRHGVPDARILAHSDIAPDRKQDPGELFPWDRLFHAGIGRWVPPVPITQGPCHGPGSEGQPVRAIQALLSAFGYDAPLTGVYDAPTAAIVTAFQRHFRPERVDGVMDVSTLMTLKALENAAH
ncbi:MAG: N-acetylmuramoyl-L-alanine amidase [Hyphomicrobiaceae bacterium]|nr:N-acetylmuramoyl-L-alanine amidase [Hyphomicrobiaceae bacterium]